MVDDEEMANAEAVDLRQVEAVRQREYALRARGAILGAGALGMPVADTELRRWAFEHAQQIAGSHALTEDVIESADAIIAWVTKKDRTND